jgi:hypothetical protein
LPDDGENDLPWRTERVDVAVSRSGRHMSPAGAPRKRRPTCTVASGTPSRQYEFGSPGGHWAAVCGLALQRPQSCVDTTPSELPATIGVRVSDAHKPHNEGRTGMASGGKKKTTMAKLTRESRLRERRLDKQAKKNARRQASEHPGQPSDTLDDNDK